MLDVLRLARIPIAGGLITTLLALATLLLTGVITGGEARYQLEATQPTIRFLCATIVTAAATVLALMVTAVSIAQTRDQPVERDHFLRLKIIATLCSSALVGGILVLMLLTVPFAESLEIAGQTYSAFYYLILGGSAVLGGISVTIILLLHATLGGLLSLIRPE